jgi:hypothetical protein
MNNRGKMGVRPQGELSLAEKQQRLAEFRQYQRDYYTQPNIDLLEID